MGKFGLAPTNVVERTDLLNYAGYLQILDLCAAKFEQPFVDILVATQPRAKQADLARRL